MSYRTNGLRRENPKPNRGGVIASRLLAVSFTESSDEAPVKE